MSSCSTDATGTGGPSDRARQWVGKKIVAGVVSIADSDDTQTKIITRIVNSQLPGCSGSTRGPVLRSCQPEYPMDGRGSRLLVDTRLSRPRNRWLRLLAKKVLAIHGGACGHHLEESGQRRSRPDA